MPIPIPHHEPLLYLWEADVENALENLKRHKTWEKDVLPMWVQTYKNIWNDPESNGHVFHEALAGFLPKDLQAQGWPNPDSVESRELGPESLSQDTLNRHDWGCW